MGVHLNESELADLEPQIFKIFKKELGFFDSDVLSSTMSVINKGIERSGLEAHLKGALDSKKAGRLCDEVAVPTLLPSCQAPDPLLTFYTPS